MYSWTRLHQGNKRTWLNYSRRLKVKWYCEIYEKASEDSSAFDVILNTFSSIPNCSYQQKTQLLYVDTKILRKEFFTTAFHENLKVRPCWREKNWQDVCNSVRVNVFSIWTDFSEHFREEISYIIQIQLDHPAGTSKDSDKCDSIKRFWF